MRQRPIPCVLMRGGTSRGPYFHAADLPAGREGLELVLPRIMGSPDSRQIDGLGGATTVTSKAAIVAPSDHPEADVDYLFAQVDIEGRRVDWKPTCGNLLAGVGPFAIDEGLVPASDGTTELTIRSVNSGAIIDAVIQTPGRCVDYHGDHAIAGVPGTAAPIELRFRHISGSLTGSALPTGRPLDRVDGVEVTCIDVAVPVVVIAAAALGLSGGETPSALNADRAFKGRLERLRRGAAQLMGLGDPRDAVVPKVAIVAPPRAGGHLTARYFTPWSCHETYAVTGAFATAAAALLPGSVAAGLVATDGRLPDLVEIEHPSGSIESTIDLTVDGGRFTVHSAGSIRTARRILAGEVYLPADCSPTDWVTAPDSYSLVALRAR